MDPSWKKSRSATSATDEPADNDHAPASQTSTKVQPEPQNEDSSPALEHRDMEQLAAVLRVYPDATASAENLIKQTAVKHFPSPPPKLNVCVKWIHI
ncbi:unnamed protein product [Gadus morhua 'NCC']